MGHAVGGLTSAHVRWQGLAVSATISSFGPPWADATRGSTMSGTDDDAASRHGQRTGLVARLHPRGPTLYPPVGLDRQRRILEILQDCPTVPSPRVVGGSDDPEIFGAPFFVMERLYGRVPADDPPFTVAGWVLELSPEERSRLYDDGLAAMAALHRLDAEERGLGFLAYPELGATPMEQQIAYYRDYYAWAVGDRPSPTIEAGFAWLDE